MKQLFNRNLMLVGLGFLILVFIVVNKSNDQRKASAQYTFPTFPIFPAPAYTSPINPITYQQYMNGTNRNMSEPIAQNNQARPQSDAFMKPDPKTTQCLPGSKCAPELDLYCGGGGSCVDHRCICEKGSGHGSGISSNDCYQEFKGKIYNCCIEIRTFCDKKSCFAQGGGVCEQGPCGSESCSTGGNGGGGEGGGDQCTSLTCPNGFDINGNSIVCR